ncbi:uncharacterized protein LOC118825392 [Colossoma macropomum]|uniref:uncharacterized protein LOC118825392 n=1 Tax=Colossoma macropomum TaxID=42526 RepID=UPI0018644CD6|nr:uncharacterized protein LOC118825392 [Colossoma macropomum]
MRNVLVFVLTVCLDFIIIYALDFVGTHLRSREKSLDGSDNLLRQWLESVVRCVFLYGVLLPCEDAKRPVVKRWLLAHCFIGPVWETGRLTVFGTFRLAKVDTWLVGSVAAALGCLFWETLLPDSEENNGKDKKQKARVLFMRVVRFYKPDYLLLIGAFVFLALAVLCEMFIPLYTGRLIDILGAEYHRGDFQTAIIFMTLFSFGSSFSAGCRGGLFTWAVRSFIRRVKLQLFGSLVRQEIGFFEVTKTGDITSRLSTDTTLMARAVALNVNVLLRTLIKTIGMLYLMFNLSWKLTLLMLMETPLTGLLQNIYDTHYQRLTKEVQDSMARTNDAAGETVSGIRTVKSFNSEQSESCRYNDRLMDTHNLKTRRGTVRAVYLLVRRLVGLGVQVAMLHYGRLFIQYGQMTTGSLVSFILYQSNLGDNIRTLIYRFGDMLNCVGAARKVFEYLDRKPEVSTDGTLQSEKLKGDVSFQKLNFCYPTRPDHSVLKDFSLELKPGQMTALVGISGGGKSTCVSLLQRFYQPQDGQILLDGQPLQNYEHKYLHSKIAVVGQEPVLFSGTVKDNIAYGLSNCSLESIQEAARKANAHDFIRELQKGYDTDVGERGSLLGSSQKQRIAIARALIRQPQVLLLDEITSFLDAKSEQAIQDVLANCPNQTLMVIAHRLKTIEKADQIIVIDQGTVLEQGTHQELMEMKGHYYKLKEKLFTEDTTNLTILNSLTVFVPVQVAAFDEAFLAHTNTPRCPTLKFGHRSLLCSSLRSVTMRNVLVFVLTVCLDFIIICALDFVGTHLRSRGKSLDGSDNLLRQWLESVVRCVFLYGVLLPCEDAKRPVVKRWLLAHCFIGPVWETGRLTVFGTFQLAKVDTWLVGSVAAALGCLFWETLLPDSEESNGKDKKQKARVLFMRVVRFYKPDYLLLIGASVFLALAVLCEMFIPLYTGRLIDILGAEYHRGDFQTAIIFMTLFSFGSSFSAGCRGGLFMCAIGSFIRRVKLQLFGSLVRQEIGFFEVTKTGDITSRLSTDTTLMARAVALNVNVLLRTLIKTIGMLYLMFSLSWKLTLLMLMETPLTGLLQNIYDTHYQRLTKEVQDSMARTNDAAGETVSGIRTVKSFNSEQSESCRYNDRLMDTHNLKTRRGTVRAVYLLVRRLVGLGVQVAMLHYGRLFIQYGQMTTGSLVSFILYQSDLGDNIRTLIYIFGDMLNCVGAAGKVFEYLDRKPEVSTDGTLQSEKLKGHVSFQKLNFCYPTRPDHSVLKDFSLELKPGQMTALVGISGGGKSTCVSLLQRFYQPQDGQILLDGQPLQNYEHKYLHSKIAVVGQEPVLFSGTVKDNIAYGLSNCSLESIQEAARKANAHDFIRELQKGYDTDVGERGSLLGSSQKQRIAIARALIRQPQVLLLDEITSFLDAKSEQAIQDVLANCPNQTLMVIAHRLKTIEKADQIIVIDQGTVLEQGTHQELMEMKGHYYKLKEKLFTEDTTNLS